MFRKLNYLLYVVLLLFKIKYIKTFNVNFKYNYNLQVEPFNTQIYKRELMQFFDKAYYSFNGFQKIESIPVLFPIDICVFSVDGSKYGATLHMKRNETRHFGVFKLNNGSYDLIADIPSPNGIAMDCINFNNKGYIAMALNLTERPQSAREGSPLYEISGNRMRAVQYFSSPNLTSVYLQVSGNDFFLLHTYDNSEETPHLYCPFFKWSGSTFNKIGRIPCSNARQLTPFSIDYENYVAVANYADQHGRTSTYSEIYKFSPDKDEFILFQKIPTNGAVDVQYFNVAQNVAKRQHFLVFGNSKTAADSLTKKGAKNVDANSVFYLLDKGQFIPYQKLSLYAVKKFLPLQSLDTEKFILLVACTDQDIKIYNFNDWKFEESKVQLTEGALGKGVSNMRVYQENENSYLIIANNLMADNETNIFLPIFKQEEHANTLRQKIIDWAQEETLRLKMVNTKELAKRVEEKLQKFNQFEFLNDMENIPQVNIETVITESLVYPKLHLTTDYWLALKHINQALDNLKTVLKQKQRSKRDSIVKSKAYENLEYAYDTLNVRTLNVNKDLKAQKVNKVNSTSPQFENITAQKVKVKTSYTKPAHERAHPLDYEDENNVLRVRNLQINGKLNNYRLDDLFNNTLKRKEVIQFLKGPIAIEALKTDTIVVTNDKVNEQDLGALVPVVGGKYIINQDIQFASPITVNQLHILERLNNIHVFNGQLDVLLKKSNKTQVIEGRKNVSDIKVLELITAAGKNDGPSTIAPTKFVHEHLFLQGTFTINGDIHINQQLNASDFVYLNEIVSAKQILDMGIRMDKSLQNVRVKFQQKLVANNSLVNLVHHHDMQKLVKLNEDDIQVIEGLKVFNGSLEIRSGFSEVKNLNGIDMEKLENNVFLINNNQTIKVPIKLGSISTKNIESAIINLDTKNLIDCLTVTGNQSIEGALLVNNVKAQFLTVQHLNTDRKIFKHDLHDLYQQKSRNAPQEDILKNNRKFHGSIYVQNLILNSTINNRPVEEIENQILQLDGNIKYVGNFKFNYPMNVTKMSFQGKLNDIPAEDFGKYWLQKNCEKQVFTAAQTIASVNADEGIILQGKLNGFKMDEFYTNTYWINRDEYIPCVNFEYPVEIMALNTKTLNDYEVPNDVLFKNTKEKPILLKSITVKKDFSVEGNILNLTSINKIKLSDLQQFLDGTIGHTLYVENANFSKSPPFYKTLNSYDIRKTLDQTWLTNENVVLPQPIEIIEANFEGLLDFEGAINNMDLDFLKTNYFSKTKLQDISVEIIFSEDVESKMDVHLNDLTVFGMIKDLKSGIPLNFNEFVQNTLKISGPHILSGNWQLIEAKVGGSLNDVLINQLNLMDDILRNDQISNGYQLTAPKTFKNLHIDSLYADTLSLVNRVPVAKWIRDSVYLYQDYTINGVTTINFLNVFNNLTLIGNLNNITFNEHNLLLTNKNQQLPRSIESYLSYLPQEKRFLTNNIEHLYTDHVNGNFLPTFIENLTPTTDNIELNGHLIFKKVLKVENYDGPEGYSTQNQLAKRNIDVQTQFSGDTFQGANDSTEKFEVVKSYLKNITKNVIYKLDHFEVVQNITTKFDELTMLNIVLEDNQLVDILAVSNKQDKNVTIFKWIPNLKVFRKTKEFSWLPYDTLSLKLIHKRFLQLEQPIKAVNLKSFISQELEDFRNVLSNADNYDNYLEFSNQHCIKFSNNLQTSIELKTLCLNTESTENTLIIAENVQQIQSLGQKHLFILTNSSVLIYEMAINSTTLLQKISVMKPKQMALGSFKDLKFLAISSRGQSNGLNHNLLEIYRSVNSSAFTFFLTLKCVEPSYITLSFIEKSNDILLHLLTDSFNKPYIIYQYQDVNGFKEILAESTLPDKSVGLDILNLYSSKQQLVALKSLESITFMELCLNKM